MDQIITQIQALQTADDTALQAIVMALQALSTPPVVAVETVTLTFNDGTTSVFVPKA